MITIKKTNNTDPDFIQLINILDLELAITDGEDHDFYHQFNGVENIVHILIAHEDEQAIACGAFKVVSEDLVEIKRMFTLEKARGKGLARSILEQLEVWAGQLGYKACILETGKKQKAALALYNKMGYEITENYGQYVGLDTSLCFKKHLR